MFHSVLTTVIANRLIYHEIQHVLIAIPFAWYLWNKTKSPKAIILYFIISIGMDIDHLFDFFGYYGFTFDPALFFKLDYFDGPGRAFVPFHAWEWILVTFLLFKKTWKVIWLILMFGMLSHLILDSINVGSIIFYSIIYRAEAGFRIFI